jgi:hypothetical protein
LLTSPNRRTLNPSGTLFICTSHEYSSAIETRASPVFRQWGHLRFSIQLSRAIRKYARQSRNVPYVVKTAHSVVLPFHRERLKRSIAGARDCAPHRRMRTPSRAHASCVLRIGAPLDMGIRIDRVVVLRSIRPRRIACRTNFSLSLAGRTSVNGSN